MRTLNISISDMEFNHLGIKNSRKIWFIETKDEAIDLATEYISEKVVGQTSYADCLHIALETIHRADFLVSWNFKHHWKYVHQENLKNMKTTEKTFDAMKFMRQERDKLSEKLSKMTKEEIIEYFNKRKSQTTIKPTA
jgi:hypothetical protein